MIILCYRLCASLDVLKPIFDSIQGLGLQKVKEKFFQ